MFGQSSRLSIDTIFDLQYSSNNQKQYDKFVAEWKDSMQEAIDTANKNAEKARRLNKATYDRKLYGNDTDVGDRLLLRNNSERGGTSKLRSNREDIIYIMTKKSR